MNVRTIKPFMLPALCLFCGALLAQNAQVTIEQPKAINDLLEYKKDLKTIDTYKIQIDDTDDPFKAEHIKTEFLSAFSERPVSIEFDTPNYKIWVGNYSNRLEADRALLRIKKKYMNAFIFRPKKD